jgi:outer membrane protein TolC
MIHHVRRAAVLLLFCASAAFAQEGPPKKDVLRLSPDEAVERAIKNNLNLEMARINLDTAKRKTDFAWNQFLPALDLRGTLSRDNWASTSAGISLPPPIGVVVPPSTLPQWHANGAFSASLTFSFALIEGMRKFRLDYEAGMASFESARIQMEQRMRQLYNNILLVQANAALLRDTYANTQRRAVTAEENYKAGQAPRLTWLQAQVSVENLKPNINDLDNNLKSLMANFAVLMGLPYDTEFELSPLETGDFYIPPDTAELISRAAAGKPDILVLQKEIQALRSARKVQSLSTYTPYLRFEWSLSSTFDPTLDPWNDGFFTADNWNKGGAFSITLGMNLNGFLPFTKEGQGIKDTDNGLLMQNIRLAQMIRETEVEIYTKLNSLEKTRTTAEAQRLTVDMAEQSYRLTEEAYRAGLQTLLEVQNAELSLEQARVQLLTQQFNYMNDLIDLEYAIGVPFGTLSSRSAQ